MKQQKETEALKIYTTDNLLEKSFGVNKLNKKIQKMDYEANAQGCTIINYDMYTRREKETNVIIYLILTLYAVLFYALGIVVGMV